MRKYICMLLIVINLFCLAACMVPEPAEDDTPDDENIVIDEALPETYNTLDIDIDGLKNLLSTSYRCVDYVSYTTDEFTIHKFAADFTKDGRDYSGPRIVCFSESSENNLSVILIFEKEGGHGFSSEAVVKIHNLLQETFNPDAYITDSFIKGKINGDLVYSISAADTALAARELPLYVKEFRNENEFFADEERCKYFEQLLVQSNYEELYNYMLQYAESYGTDDDTELFTCITNLETLVPLLSQVNVQYDDFENESTIYYNGLTEIDYNNYFLPYCQTSSRGSIGLVYKAGFENSDWIFFDTIYIKSANCETKSDHYNTSSITRDVISGGIIEYINYSMRAEILNDIINNGVDAEVKIRFVNDSSGEYIEQTLSADVISAIICLSQIKSLHHDIYYTEYGYLNF